MNHLKSFFDWKTNLSFLQLSWRPSRRSYLWPINRFYFSFIQTNDAHRTSFNGRNEVNAVDLNFCFAPILMWMQASQVTGGDEVIINFKVETKLTFTAYCEIQKPFAQIAIAPWIIIIIVVRHRSTWSIRKAARLALPFQFIQLARSFVRHKSVVVIDYFRS